VLKWKREKAAAWLAWLAMCDHAVWWAGKKRAEEPVKMETGCAGDQSCKSLHHFFSQELESKLPECLTISSEIEVGHLI
jgi:hypothetical protein